MQKCRSHSTASLCQHISTLVFLMRRQSQQWNSINIVMYPRLNFTVLFWIIKLSHPLPPLPFTFYSSWLFCMLPSVDGNFLMRLELLQSSSFELLGGGHGGVRAVRTLLEGSRGGSLGKSDPDFDQNPENLCLVSCKVHLHMIQLRSAWQRLLWGKCLQDEAKQESGAWNPNKLK